MSDSVQAGREEAAKLLEQAGYELQERRLAEHEASVLATPYAVVACVELEGWENLEEQVSDIQADLTKLAREAPSARSWDLYLIILLAQEARNGEQQGLIEAIESDTTYTRKFIHAGLSGDALDQALRPLLPLRAVAELEIDDPFAELRSELLAIGVEEATVERALSSFEREKEVQLK